MSNYCICWDSYKNNICDGFSRLQQNQEFVDMTLAAEGHFVKVHQNIIALASPYLKSLIQSATCQHPVIFLSEISHEVLCLILEYIYTGEVILHVDKVNDFVKAAKALCITGIQDIAPVQTSFIGTYSTSTGLSKLSQVNIGQDIEISELPHNKKRCDLAAAKNITPEDTVFPITPNATHRTLHNNYCDKNEGDLKELIDDDTCSDEVLYMGSDNQDLTELTEEILENTEPLNLIDNNKPNVIDFKSTSEIALNEPVEQNHAFSIKINANSDFTVSSNVPLGNSQQYAITVNPNPEFMIANTTDMPTDIANKNEVTSSGKKNESEDTNKLLKMIGALIRYSVSNRGALQLVVNRYVYYCHHSAGLGRRRRWRCLDYRRQRCKAFIDSVDGEITLRKFSHQHPFHDKQILKKIRKNQLFNTIVEAEEATSNRDQLVLGE